MLPLCLYKVCMGWKCSSDWDQRVREGRGHICRHSSTNIYTEGVCVCVDGPVSKDAMWILSIDYTETLYRRVETSTITHVKSQRTALTDHTQFRDHGADIPLQSQCPKRCVRKVTPSKKRKKKTEKRKRERLIDGGPVMKWRHQGAWRGREGAWKQPEREGERERERGEQEE